MAIRKTDRVTLNGSSTGYGGLITSASYSVGFGTSITQATLTFVSENGEYTISEDDLNVFSSDNIRLGSRKLNMIAVEYSIDNSMSGKILKVIYNDKSILILDKKFVALEGKNFPATNASDALILVGQKYFTHEKESGDESITISRSTVSDDIRKVGDYLYNFQELMVKISANCQGTIPGTDDVVLKDFTGTLRNVLSAWGSLYGFTFFFNESGKIQFIDLKQSITPVFPVGVKFISERNSFSLKDTISKGHSVYYGKPGKDLSSEALGGSGVDDTTTPVDPDFDYGEFEEDSDTSITLYRAFDDPGTYWNNPGFAIDLGKAAAIGQEFFQLYAMALCFNNPATYSNVFGYGGIEKISGNQKKAFDPKNELFADMDIIKYVESGSQTISIETVKQKFAQYLTYENNLAERTWFKHNWAIGADLNYDINDETSYINASRSSNAGDNHRIFASVPFEIAFDIYDSVQNMDLNQSLIPLEVNSAARKEARSNKTFSPKVKFAAILKNAPFSNILNRVKFIYKDRKQLRVEGLRIESKAKVSFNPGSGGDDGGKSFSAAVESTISRAPSYTDNTVLTDVDIETSPSMVSALSDIIQTDGSIKYNGVTELNGTLANYPSLAYVITAKRVEKSFTVNNIDLEVSSQPTIEKGLQSMDISIGDSGVKTTYTMGNRNFTLPSKELLTQPRGFVSSISQAAGVQKNMYSLQSKLNDKKSISSQNNTIRRSINN